jgi:tripartite-type tricarboxylate transporter receptor subunit TctC
MGMLAETAWAQTLPSHALRIIVNAPHGGPTDLVARMIAARISDSTGQSVIVDNRPGGGSQIAAAQLMQSPADGNTLLVGDIGAFAINASLYAKLSFDPLKDFQPISTLMSSPSVLIVPAVSPSNSLQELLERAKSPHGRLTFASAGLGSGAHLIAEMLKTRTGAKLDHVPYNGMPQATHAVVAGEVDLLFQVMGVALPLSKAGKVKVLAIASPARSPRMPEVPTTSELGHPYLRMSPWFGVVTRSGTPQDVVARLHRKVTDALAHPDTTKRLGELGYDPFPSSPEQFASFMREESERWAQVVQASGTRAN